jgi:cobalt-zinc-cadmium efflux system outer membrane protein
LSTHHDACLTARPLWPPAFLFDRAALWPPAGRRRRWIFFVVISESSMHIRFPVMGAAALLLPLFAHAAATGQQTITTATTTTTTSAPSVGLAGGNPLSLQEAIRLALEASPGLCAARLDIGIADADKLQAGLLPNPELALLREGMDKGTRTQTVEISQRFELGGKRAARVSLAEGERRVAVQQVAIAVAALRADVTAAYFDALSAHERLELSRASLQLAAKATQAATRRVAAGRISPVEQSRSQVAEAAVRLEVAQAAAELGLARQRLANLWGGTDGVERPLLPVPPEAAPLPSLAALRAQLDGTPQLRRAQELVEREGARVRLARAERIPDITVTLGNQRDDEIGRHQAVIGLSVPLPLFNRNQGAELAALRRADKARADADAERVRVSQALTEAYRRAVQAQAEVAGITTEILPAAQSAYDAAVTGFELGKFGFLDVLDAQRTLFQVRAQYLRALSERYRHAADLERYAVLPSAPQP